MSWPSAAHAVSRFFGLVSGGCAIPEVPLGPAGDDAAILWDSEALLLREAEQSPVCSMLKTWVSSLTTALGICPGSLLHPHEQDGAVSTILCWTQVAPQTRRDGLESPKEAQPGFPLPCEPTPGSSIRTLCWGRAGAV